MSMENFLRFIGITIALMSAQVSLGELPPGYAGAWSRDRFVWCKVRTGGIRPNPAVAQSLDSGTAVGIEMKAMTPYEEVPGYSKPPQPPYTQPAWNRFEVLSCELKVNGETLPTPVDAGASSPQDRGYEGAYRISSPHFSDGTSVPITFKATIKLSRVGTSDTQTISVTASWTMVAFNKALIWATADNWADVQNAYYWSPTDLYAREAAIGASDAEVNTNRQESRYAQMLSGTNVQQRSRAQILGALSTSTLTFAFTHGELRGLSSSEINAPGLTWCDWPDIQTAVQANRGTMPTVPPPNSVVVYACVGAAGNVGENSFGAAGWDRFFVGFEYVVWSLMLNNNPLSTHSTYLMDMLSRGWSVRAALDHIQVNMNQMPARLNEHNIPMPNPMILGYDSDPNATIATVYTESPKNGVSQSWYLLLYSRLQLATE